MSIMASLSSILMQQMVQNMAINDVNRAYQAQGGKVNIYGTNNTGLTNKQANSFSALGWATLFSSFLPFLKPLLQGLINGIAEKELKKNPPEPGQKSSVNDYTQKSYQVNTQAQLENKIINNKEILNKFLKGDNPALTLLDKAKGETSSIGDTDNLRYKDPDDDYKNAISNSQHTLTQAITKQVNLDSLNNYLKEAVNLGNLPELSFDNLSFKDNNISFDDIKCDIEIVTEFKTNLSDYEEKLNEFINRGALTDDEINWNGNESFSYQGQEYGETDSLPDGAPQTKIDEFNKWKTNRQNRRKDAQKALNDAKDAAKKQLDEIQEKSNAADLYLDQLNSLEIVTDGFDNDQKKALESQLKDDSLSMGELLEFQDKEQQSAIDLLNKITGGNYNKDNISNVTIEDGITENVKNYKENLDKEIKNDQGQLKLLDFLTEGYKDLSGNSNISKSQLKALQGHAQALLEDTSNPSENKYDKLVKYANGMGINLKELDAETTLNKNGKVGVSDTNGNSEDDNWTFKATDGVSVGDFARANGFNDPKVVSDWLKAQGKDDTTKISSNDAKKLMKKAGTVSTSYKIPKFGDLDTATIKDKIDTRMMGDEFKNHISKSENKDILKDLSNEQKKIDDHKKEVEKNKEKIISFLLKNGIAEGFSINYDENGRKFNVQFNNKNGDSEPISASDYNDFKSQFNNPQPATSRDNGTQNVGPKSKNINSGTTESGGYWSEYYNPQSGSSNAEDYFWEQLTY